VGKKPGWRSVATSLQSGLAGDILTRGWSAATLQTATVPACLQLRFKSSPCRLTGDGDCASFGADEDEHGRCGGDRLLPACGSDSGRRLVDRPSAAIVSHVGPAMTNTTVAAEIIDFFGLSRVPNDGADLTKVEKLAAAIDSANYLNTRMYGAQRFANDFELLEAGMARRAVPDGLILEFGVYSGRTINHIASLTNERVYGFDSFKGLPEDWRSEYGKGSFATASLPTVANNVELVVGLFDQTLPDFLAKHPQPVSLLHVDSDLYSSAKTVLTSLKDRIVRGTIIVFDEYFNYVGWRNHEFKAFQEFVRDGDLRYRYIGAVPFQLQAGVVID
jgi:hypothetical protein